MSTQPNFNTITDEVFYAVISRLKTQGALAKDTFVNQIPFFSFGSVEKASQVKELFQEQDEQTEMYNMWLRNIIAEPDETGRFDFYQDSKTQPKVLSFAQIVLYKTLPCSDANCPRKPREIATHNQYKDAEYECPFYHHDRDQRRIVITSSVDEEFVYKANYYEEGKRHIDKDKYSQNYFESMFHPLYYKMFRCKREFCDQSKFCPFFHNEDEKLEWDRTFVECVKKERISYVKDKNKYYGHAAEGRHENRGKNGAHHAPEASRGSKGEFKPKGFKNPIGNGKHHEQSEMRYESKPFQARNQNNYWKKDDALRKSSDEYLSADSKNSSFGDKSSMQYSVCQYYQLLYTQE